MKEVTLLIYINYDGCEPYVVPTDVVPADALASVDGFFEGSIGHRDATKEERDTAVVLYTALTGDRSWANAHFEDDEDPFPSWYKEEGFLKQYRSDEVVVDLHVTRIVRFAA